MSVSVVSGGAGGEIGAPSFFTAFFSTILVRLENGSWGSRFPVIMKELYSGSVPPAHALAAQDELRKIREELQRFRPDEVVWDFENLAAKPPWGNRIAQQIRDLSNYFVTSGGRDLIDLLSDTLAYSEAHGVALEIR
jgi:2,3-bisphosphoglycerate-dependent phosphoglycerate mutase